MEKNYLEDFSTSQCLALLFLHQAERRKLLNDLVLDDAAFEAWDAFQETFRLRLQHLDESKTRYLLTFSHPQSSEGIDPFDAEQVQGLIQRYAPLMETLVERRRVQDRRVAERRGQAAE